MSNKNEFVEDKKVDMALGKTTVNQIFETARRYGKENEWEGKPKSINLWQKSNSSSFFWTVQFALDPELDDWEYEYAIGSLGQIIIDDETGKVLETQGNQEDW